MKQRTLIGAGALLALALVLAPLGGAIDHPFNGGTDAHAEEETGGASLSPGAAQREKAKVVGDLLQRYHYSGRSIDSDMADNAIDAYLKHLDRGRDYLLQGDVDEFRDAGDAVTAGLKDGELEPAFELFRTYRTRVRERVDFALDQVSALDFEFESDERFEQDRREADWAADRDELDEIWRKRVQHDALTLHLAGRDADEIRDNLERRYQNIARTAEESDAEEVMNRYLTAWASAFDPHSGYFSPQRSEDFDINMSLQLEGIGAKLTVEQDFTEIVELIPGGPAEQSGKLSKGERIIGVADGEDGEMNDIVGWQLRDVVDLIRGPKESTVRLKILPPSGSGDSEPREIELVRNKVDLEDQAARSDVIERETDTGGVERVGVIEIPTFYRDFEAAQADASDFRSTTRDVRRLLEELVEQDIDGLIIDLRGNSGGSLREATALTALFAGGGPAVQVRNHRGNLEQVGEDAAMPVYGGPLGVMVDRGSASASEIFAAAIQDYGRGVVIGDQTFGKGTVQQMINLDNYAIPDEDQSGRLKLTIAQFYRVTGESTQLEGVTPDIVLPSDLNHDEVGERATENALPATRIDALDVERNRGFSDLIPALVSRHEERMKEDGAFRAFKWELEHHRKTREETSVPLDLQLRKAERDARDESYLSIFNERRRAHGMEPVDSVDDIDEDSLPDVLRLAAADIVRDLARLEKEEGGDREALMARWTRLND